MTDPVPWRRVPRNRVCRASSLSGIAAARRFKAQVRSSHCARLEQVQVNPAVSGAVDRGRRLDRLRFLSGRHGMA